MVLLSCLLGIVIGTHPPVVRWQIAALACAPLMLWLLVGRPTGLALLSPAFSTVTFFSLAGIVGYAVYAHGAYVPGSFFRVPQSIAEDALSLFAATTWLIAAGAATVHAVGGRPRQSGHGFTPLRFSPSGQTAALAVGALPLAVVLLHVGSFVDRSGYLFAARGSLVGVSAQALLAAVGLFGYVAAAAVGLRRALAVALVACSWLALFSLGTRGFALAPLTLALGLLFHAPVAKWRVILVACVATVLLLPVPLFLRNQTSHGLVPYAGALSRMPYDLSAIKYGLGNVFLGLPVSGITAYASPAIPPRDLVIELNPLPGSLAGWNTVQQRLRIASFYPYAGIGELRNFGWPALISYWIAVGLFLGYLGGRVRGWLSRGRRFQMAALLLVALGALFAITMTSYNLRTGTRILWYMLGFDCLVRLLGRTRLSEASDRSEEPAATSVPT